jgi:type IV pilus assembly protein PilW
MNQRGESMVSLLVGLAIGLLVLAGAVNVWINTLQGQRAVLQDSHLQQDLRSATALMAQEIRKAHYTNAAWRSRTSAQCADQFCGGADDFTVSKTQIEFSWDRDDDGLKDNNECTGFQLKSNELRAKTACSPAVWTAITDAGSIKVTTLQFTSHCHLHQGSLRRQIDVLITASLPNDASTVFTHTQSIALLNPIPATSLPADCS